ncbi:NAD(P)H-binding protein [Dietzia sp.]|uniref:NAD(P)H-binding protein n=1 Tax=Dietzia sp. TaxID=1871616 RepID=UPI002FD8D396
MKILVIGARGYVGSRLIPELIARGHTVIAGIRDVATASAILTTGTLITHCDVLDEASVIASLTHAGEPVDAVIYLVHRMSYGSEFAKEDARGARTVCQAMAAAGVGRCVYLSGLRPDCDDQELSAHMRSRLEVEELLAIGPTPTLTIRAGVIIGAGSTSFEALRGLCELLPLQPIAPWMRHRIEPVAEVDVLEVLCGSLVGPPQRGSIDIGCGEQFTYPELLRLYARLARRPILQIPIPAIPCDLVAHALANVVPHDGMTVAAMIDSLCHDMVCADNSTRKHDLVPAGWAWKSAHEAIHTSLYLQTAS